MVMCVGGTEDLIQYINKWLVWSSGYDQVSISVSLGCNYSLGGVFYIIHKISYSFWL